jgi:phosphate transport system substrate-binding protein
VTKATPDAAPIGPVALQGAGSAVPYPLYSRLFEEYERSNELVHITYQSIGSGEGIRQLTDRTIDFGASGVPMTDKELAAAPAKLVHIPVTLGAVVLAYNIPGVPTGLRLTPDVIAGIYFGNIRRWNAPRIAVLNPGRKLPSQAINVIYRSDESGTTGVFASYLAAVSPRWKDSVGAGKTARFPAGQAVQGSEGMVTQVKSTPGAIGYVELAHARQANLPYATLMNRSGKYVEPTLEGISAAAAGAAGAMAEDFRVSIVDAPGDGAYPLSSFDYIVAYQDMADAAKARALVKFLWWVVHDGQRLGAALDHAQLPASVVAKVDAKLNTLTVRGQPIL